MSVLHMCTVFVYMNNNGLNKFSPEFETRCVAITFLGPFRVMLLHKVVLRYTRNSLKKQGDEPLKCLAGMSYVKIDWDLDSCDCAKDNRKGSVINLWNFYGDSLSKSILETLLYDVIIKRKKHR